MNLTREHWTKQDIGEFQAYLVSLSKGKEKADMEKRIANTNLPCLAVPCTCIDDIVKKIYKGNFMEFIDLWIWEYLANTIIIGKLIGKIKDFDTMKAYLTKYSAQVDNWAGTDSVKFNIKPENEANYLLFAQELISSHQIFCRRQGVIILLKLVGERTIDKILELSKLLYDEEEYYVNMAHAWLIAECFIKEREKTLKYLKEQTLNDFVINKAVSKCRDSYRVSAQDKEMLLKFKR